MQQLTIRLHHHNEETLLQEAEIKSLESQINHERERNNSLALEKVTLENGIDNIKRDMKTRHETEERQVKNL